MSDDRVKLTAGERRLPCKLSEERQIELGAELAMVARRLDRMREDHRARKSEMRAAEQIEQAGILEISGWIANGAEPKVVGVEWFANFGEDRAELVRTDTGEIVETRELTDEDRQLLLPDGPAPVEAPKRSRGRKRTPVGEVEELPDEPEYGGVDA